MNSYRPCIPVACTLARSEDVVWTFLAKKMRPNAGAKYGLSKLLLNIMKWTEIRVEFLCRWCDDINEGTMQPSLHITPLSPVLSVHICPRRTGKRYSFQSPSPPPSPIFNPSPLGTPDKRMREPSGFGPQNSKKPTG